MAGHAQLKFVMTECSKTQIRLTGLTWSYTENVISLPLLTKLQNPAINILVKHLNNFMYST